MGNLDLCSSCGYYCGACDIYNANIEHHAAGLKGIMDAYGFDFSDIPGMTLSNPEFQAVLDNLVTYFRPGVSCREGCGACIHNCAVKRCVQERGVDTCAFCDQFPCEKLEGHGNLALAGLKEQRELGLQAWADRMAAKVAAGWSYLD